MRFHFVTEAATFIERPNRFRIVARLDSDGQRVDAHCADPGRLRELLIPGVTIHLSRAANPNRKTGYDLRFVEHPVNGQLVSLDTRLPNQIVAEGLQSGFFEPFRGSQEIRAEVGTPHVGGSGVRSRFDFRLVTADGHVTWIEVKSVTLVENRVARFPDAPTERGRRHLQELTALVQKGDRAAVLFIVQRPDADRVEPNVATDPAFAAVLDSASRAGVDLLAATCQLTTQEIRLSRLVPVVPMDL